MPSRPNDVRTMSTSAQTSDSNDEPPASNTPTTLTGRFFLSSKRWPSSRPLNWPRMRLPMMTSSVPGCGGRPAMMRTSGRSCEHVVGDAAQLHVRDCPALPALVEREHDQHLARRRSARPALSCFTPGAASDQADEALLDRARQLGVGALAQHDRVVGAARAAHRLAHAVAPASATTRARTPPAPMPSAVAIVVVLRTSRLRTL